MYGSLAAIDLPLSWLITGLVIGGGLIGLIWWLRNKAIKVTWYEWLIGVIGLLLVLLGVQNFAAAFQEYESQASWHFLWTIILPGLILLAVSWQLAWRRHRSA